MASIAQATIDINASIAKLRADLARGAAEVNKFQRRVESGFRSTRNLLAGLGIGLGVSQIVSFGRAVIDTAGQINDMAAQLSLGTDELQAMNFAAREAGVGAEAMQAGVIRLNESIGEAVGGNKAMRQSFADLGVAFADANGNARDNEAVLADLARAYDEAADKTKFTADLTDVMGRTAGRLVPILDELGDGWAAFSAGAEEAGQVMRESTVAALDALGDAIEREKNRMMVFWAEAIAGAAKFLGFIERPIAEQIGAINEEMAALIPTIEKLNAGQEAGGFLAGEAEDARDRFEELKRQRIELLQLQRSLGGGEVPPTITPSGTTGGGGSGSRAPAKAAIDAEASALSELIQHMQTEVELLRLSERERAAAVATREAEAAAMQDGNLLTAEQIARVRELALAEFDLRNARAESTPAIEDATAAQWDLNAAGAEYGRILGGIATGTMTWRDLALAAIDDVTAALIDLLNTSASGGGGGLFGSLFGFVGSLFGGSGPVPGQIGTIPGIMGHGGPVTAGAPYIVGDRGPELFVPGRSGAIVPNGEFGTGGSTFVIDARGADRQGLARLEGMIRSMNGSIERRSVAAVRDFARRSSRGADALAS